jgi:hypothetical protein
MRNSKCDESGILPNCGGRTDLAPLAPHIALTPRDPNSGAGSPSEPAEGGGAPEITAAQRAALEDAFRGWLADNGHALELGGTGDVHALVLTLAAALENSN